MGESFLDKNGGGFDINGLKKDYYVWAGENISAGSFVEFVNGVASTTNYGTSSAKSLSPSNVYYTGKSISVVALDENRVFIAHSYGTSYNLYGMIVTINEKTITSGTDTVLASSSREGEYISNIILLNNGNVFIAHSYGSSSYLYGIVCSVNGTTITAGTNKKIVASNYASKFTTSLLLDSGNVFIGYAGNTNYNLYGIVCSVSGTTITLGTSVSLSHYCDGSSSTLLKDGRIFITYRTSDNDINNYLGAKICSVTGTTITIDLQTYQLSTVDFTGLKTKTVTLENGNVLITHSYSTSYYIYGMVCSISENMITKGIDTQLVANDSAAYSMSLSLLKNGDVFMAHRKEKDAKLYGMIIKVSGLIISSGEDTILNSAAYTCLTVSTILLNNGTIFIAHNYNNSYYVLYAQIFGIDEVNNVPTKNIIIPTYETQVRNITTSNANGIAKTSGVGGDSTGHNEQIQVYVPDI